ncbi:RNA-guided endonuclease InsQ/TnpB family protein [Bacillus sp. NPDC094106]|uniref:RNA-guided endonuclease InsQ/TnpB family protein n=1 Tax=Bacillus sp. NPDC094106 TaxID=3363949 RepID=UPI00382150C1
MLRAKKVYFSATQEMIQRLFDCNRISSSIWNECLHIAKQYSLSQDGKWINKTLLQKELKGKYALHSQSIQAVAHKYLFARDATHQAIKKGIKTARYPYKQKKNFNTKWVDKGFRIYPNGKIELSMGRGRNPIVVQINPLALPRETIKEIECCYDNGLYFAVSFEDGVQPCPSLGTRSVGVDLGEIHSIASFCENGEALIITGRKIRSIQRLRNKKIAELQKLLSKCKKGSRQWKKYQRAKRFILSKSEKQMQDALHKTTKQFVDWCLQQDVQHIYVGNPEGVQRHTKKKKRKQINQKLSNWSFGKLKKYLQYKAIQHGMSCTVVEESYTSQTCPCCQKKKKVTSRNYHCSCGYQEHRDIHGARNILSKSLYKQIQHIPVQTKQTYLRIA